ncbi:putative mucin TcMUCII [Trypanosoma cruzi]|nr:putative mucin TcMUCII [Trypanosoma cruzi]
MMTTCRLLCALLALALCCCPSVCAGDTQEATDVQAVINESNLSPVSPEPMAAAPNGSVTGPAAPEPGGIPGNGQAEAAENSATEPVAEEIEPEAAVLAVPGPKVNTELNTSLTEGTNGNKGSEIGTRQPADQTDNKVEVVTETTESITATVSPENTKNPEANGKGANLLPSASRDKQGKGNSESSGLGSSADSGNVGGSGRISTNPDPQSNEVSNTTEKKGTESTTGSESRASSSAEQANKNVDDPAETTTTTTKAPTTSSTTTTHAPSTTTTEAPAVSTTRAPSRLREIDGSLSSSAWVCAPLVLAASALAYTAVG